MKLRRSVKRQHPPPVRPGETTTPPARRAIISSSAEPEGTYGSVPLKTDRKDPSRKRIGRPLSRGPPRSKRCLDKGVSQVPVAVAGPSFTLDNAAVVKRSSSPDNIAVVKRSTSPGNAIVELSSSIDNIAVVEPTSSLDNIAFVELSSSIDNIAVVEPTSSLDNIAFIELSSHQDFVSVVEPSSAPDDIGVVKRSSSPDIVAVAEPSCALDQFRPTTPLSSQDSDDDDDVPITELSIEYVGGIGQNQKVTAHFGSKVHLEALERGREFDEANELQMPSQKFNWSQDYSTFRGQKSEFIHPSGPTKPTTDPLQCFLNTWDEEIIKLIVEQTNLYAEQEKAIHERERPNETKSRFCTFQPTTVDEIYRLLAIFIEQSVCSLGCEKEYWYSESANFQTNYSSIIPYTRFMVLKRLLHFVNNDKITDPPSGDSVEHKLRKVLPIIEHCRNKFQEQYTPEQNIALDESLMLWKGNISFSQFIKTKAARFGIKTYELCESRTGYLYDFYVYTGRESSPAADQSWQTRAWPAAGASVRTVLHLMRNLYDKHHVLYMDSYYNSPTLARYLKNRGTDCVGTLKAYCKNLPDDVARAKVGTMDKGSVIARHCGDVSVLAWRDKKNKVMTISTLHDDGIGEKIKMRKFAQGEKTTQVITMRKPKVILDYNKHMGGVDLKDQRLSSFLMERKRNQVWYKTFFKRLLNTSILNMYIIYSESVKIQTRASHPDMREADLTVLSSKGTLSHRQFRYTIARRLFDKFRGEVEISSVATIRNRKIFTNFHGPELIPREASDPKFGRVLSRNCIVCSAGKPKRTRTIYRCKVCLVALCVTTCFSDFHELRQLPS